MADAGQPDAGARMALTALRAAPGWAAAASLARGEAAPPPSGLLALWTALR